MGYKGGERNSRFDGERTDVLLSTGGTNTAKSILRWSSEIVQDLVELINVAEKVSVFHITGILTYPYSLPLKIGFPRRSSASMHPMDQTSMAVDWISQRVSIRGSVINSGRAHVVGETQHDLGGSVPPGGNVFGHETLVRTALCAGTPTRSVPSRKAEVADFELTVRINQEVTRLEVTMNNVSGVNVLETAKGLINKGLEMSVREWLLRPDLRWIVFSSWWVLGGESDLRWHADPPPSVPPGSSKKNIERRFEMKIRREDRHINKLRQNSRLV